MNINKFISFSLLLMPLTFPCNVQAADRHGEEFTTFMGFELNKVTLDDIQRKFGIATLFRPDESDHHDERICYISSDAIVSFISGEMGGSEHDLLEVEIEKRNPEKEQKFTPLPAQYSMIPTINGLHLGMGKNEFIKSFSTKIEWEEETGTASFDSEIPMSEEDLKKRNLGPNDRKFYDRMIYITGQFKKGKLVLLNVGKSETY